MLPLSVFFFSCHLAPLFYRPELKAFHVVRQWKYYRHEVNFWIILTMHHSILMKMQVTTERLQYCVDIVYYTLMLRTYLNAPDVFLSYPWVIGSMWIASATRVTLIEKQLPVKEIKRSFTDSVSVCCLQCVCAIPFFLFCCSANTAFKINNNAWNIMAASLNAGCVLLCKLNNSRNAPALRD